MSVQYVEQTLGFHPSYWEIGNEPTAWTHFAIPWDRWSTSDNSTPTPLEYAQMVQKYVLAVRSVDPTAQILGIQSDAGSPFRSAWFTTLMEIDGPNLSAVAYHSYTGGVGVPGETLPQFFATLSQLGSFPLNYPLTRATVGVACPGCTTRVFVGEYNSARYGNLTGYASSYPEAPYIAAGLTEGLEENASQVTFYGLQPGGAAGLLDAKDQPLPVYYDYATFFQNLALPWVHNASAVGGPGGVYALVAHNTTGASDLIVDTNDEVGLTLSFGAGTAIEGLAQVYLFAPGLAVPTVTSMTLNSSSVVKVPPEGILMINGAIPSDLPTGHELGGGAIAGGPPRGDLQTALASPPALAGGAGGGGGERTFRSRSIYVS